MNSRNLTGTPLKGVITSMQVKDDKKNKCFAHMLTGHWRVHAFRNCIIYRFWMILNCFNVLEKVIQDRAFPNSRFNLQHSLKCAIKITELKRVFYIKHKKHMNKNSMASAKQLESDTGTATLSALMYKDPWARNSKGCSGITLVDFEAS